MSSAAERDAATRRWTDALVARSATVMGLPSEADGWWYFLLRKAHWPTHRVVRVRPGGGLDDVRTVVDPETFVLDGTITDWQMVGSKVLVGITDGTEYGLLRIIDPKTRQPMSEPFGQTRVFAAAYQKAAKGQPDRLYHVHMDKEDLQTGKYLMVRENPLEAGAQPQSVPVELAPPRWGPRNTFLTKVSVQTDGADRFLVVTETQGIGLLHRTSVYDVTTPTLRPQRVAVLETTAGSPTVKIRKSSAYFLSTDNGRRPHGALFRAPLREVGDRRSWQTVLPGDDGRRSHLVGFAVANSGVEATWRHHGRDRVTVHPWRKTANGPVAGAANREFASPGTPFAALGGAKELVVPRTKHGTRLVSWVDVGGPRVWVYPPGAGPRATPQEWAVSRELRERGPAPTPTVTRDIPFRFGPKDHQTGVVRLTVPKTALGADRPPTVLMRDAYPYYGGVQSGLQAGTLMYDHMLNDAVHAAGGATAMVYHDNSRGGTATVAEMPYLLIGAAQALAARGAATPGRIFAMGASAQSYAVSEAVRLRSDLFAGAVIRSGMLRTDDQGLSGGVGFCQVGPQAYGPDAQAVSAHRRMRDEGIVAHPGVRRILLLLSYGRQDTRTPYEDHTLPYALAAKQAGADVRLYEFSGGHFMQWARPHGGGAGAFAQPMAQVEAVHGGLGPRPRPPRLETAITIAAGLSPVLPLPPPTRPHTDASITPPPPTQARTPTRTLKKSRSRSV